MATKYTVNSVFKLNSGYEIPLLGFGVSSSAKRRDGAYQADWPHVGLPNVSAATYPTSGEANKPLIN
jgi:hypothetical protein